jgi:hypothetical protein
MTAWHSKQSGIAFSILSVPPSDFGFMWSVSILTPQQRWQMQHRRLQPNNNLATSFGLKAVKKISS